MKAEVIINHIHVDLSDDFSITIEKNSQLTQFKELIDTWAYNLTFPRTETNEAAFEHVERFEKKFIGWQEYPFQFVFNGRLLLNGKIKAKFRGGLYEGYAFGTMGAMVTKMLVPRIADIAFSPLPFTNKSNYVRGVDPYCFFPIYNTLYYKGRSQSITIAGQETEVLTYQFLTTQGGMVNRYDSGLTQFVKASGVSNYNAVLSPFLFTWFMLEETLKFFGITTTENILKTDTLLNQTCIFTSFDITRVDEGGYTVYIPSEGDPIGENTTNFFQQTVKSVSDFSPAELFPGDWTVGDLLIGIQNMLNVMLVFSDKDPSVKVVDREAIFSGAAIDLNSKLLQSPELDLDNEKKIVLKFGIDQNDSQWVYNSDNELLNKYFGFHELSDDQRRRIKGTKNTYAEVEAITGMKLGDIWYISSQYRYMEYRIDIVETVVDGEVTRTDDVLAWYQISIYGQPFIVGDLDAAEETIETKFGVVNGANSVARRGMSLTGNSDEFSANKKEFVPRIMLYEGFISDEHVAPQLTGDMDMNWRGTNGLFEKRWKNTVKAISEGIKGVAYFDFNEVEFAELNLNKKFRIDEGAFIIEKSTTTFTLDHIKPTEASILKLP